MHFLKRLLPVLTILLLAACSTVPYDPPPPARSELPQTRTPQPPAAQAPVATPRGGGYYKDDGPADSIPVNLDEIPDAVPRHEPIRAANTRPYVALGQSFTPMRALQPFRQEGIGSWYGKKFHGAKTASGERYDMFAMTAAHPTLPLPSYARVTSLENGRSVVVRVNDRGPFLHGRIIDLSYAAAWKLGYINKGSARLLVEVITAEEISSGRFARAQQPSAQVLPPAPPRPEAEVPPPAIAPMVSTTATLVEVPAVAIADAPPAPSGVFLQLGAFASSANAEGFRDYVKSELTWLRQEVVALLIGDKYRLQVGPFRDTEEARTIAERIAAAIRVQPFVVQR